MLMQSRTFEEFRAVGRVHPHVEGDAVPVERERHFHAGTSERPNLAIQTGERGYPIAADRNDDIARLDLGACSRSFGRDADDHYLVFDLGRIKTEPRPHRSIDAAELAEIVEDWIQQVDRHDHVEMLVFAFA